MKKNNDSLGDRMKGYEAINRTYLIPNMHNVIRLDGKAFHTYTKGFKRPFDDILINCMDETAKYLCDSIQGAKFAYVQSDEISIYFTDTDSFDQQLWFKGNIQKIVSVAASKAAAKFNHIMFIEKMKSITQIHNDIPSPGYNQRDFKNIVEDIKLAEFDARVYQLPNKDEMINAFIWRQQDCIRNSISAVAQYRFSHKELHKKSTKDMKEMLNSVNDPWENYGKQYRNGRFIMKNMYINDIKVAKKGYDGIDQIWYQPDNQGLFKSKYGRALQWFENTDAGGADWCDIEIEKIRTKWDIEGADNFVEQRNVLYNA